MHHLIQTRNLKLLSCNKKAIYQTYFSASSQMDTVMLEPCLRKLLGNENEKDKPHCYRQKEQKPDAVIRWGCIRIHNVVTRICVDLQRLYWSYGKTYAAIYFITQCLPEGLLFFCAIHTSILFFCLKKKKA